MVEGVDVVGIINIKGDMLKILQNEISHLTTRSRITMKHNNRKRANVYKINHQKSMKTIFVGVV